MLRRKPTAIALTTEDIAIYEDARMREALLREQAAQAQVANGNGKTQNKNPNADFRGYAQDFRNGEKTRADRLGLRSGGSSRN